MAETRQKSAERDRARGVNDGRSGMEKEISRALRPFQKKLAAEAALRAVCVSGLFALPVWLALALARRCFGGAVGRPEALMLPVWALLAAALYALNAPVSKLLLGRVPERMMAAFLYLGAGVGMGAVKLIGRGRRERSLRRDDLPYVIGMIALDIAAPILLMLGLRRTTPETAALLNNFEIVATSLIALILFRETISRRLWLAIVLVTAASALLSVEDAGSLRFSAGSIYVLLACVCWGFENNCTRRLSDRSPLDVVIVKGLFSGAGALGIAFFAGERLPGAMDALAAMLLGFVAFGMSIFFYIRAQRDLGAARTSAYYALAPFIGAGLSLAIFRDMPGATFFLALAIMIAGAYLASSDGKPA